MEYSDKFTPEDFDKFKEQLIFLSETHFRACEIFKHKLKNSKTINNIINILEHYNDDIYERLGGYDLNDKIEDLENEIDELKSEIYYLEEKFSNSLEIKTLHDEMKRSTYIKYKDKFNPWEFEDLMENG